MLRRITSSAATSTIVRNVSRSSSTTIISSRILALRNVVASASAPSISRISQRHFHAGVVHRSASASPTTSASSSTPLKRIGVAVENEVLPILSSKVALLCEEARTLMFEKRFEDARTKLLAALDQQQTEFLASTTPQTFLSTVRLLNDIVTCIRMCGVDPSDMSSLDSVVLVYTTRILPHFLAANPQHRAVLENPTVYTFVCFTAGCYIDGEGFAKAKALLTEQLLQDVDRTPPTTTDSGYAFTDLRLASALNFIGIAEYSDHSGCGGHDHDHEGHHHHHHHTHDHAKAGEAWNRALEYTRSFTRSLRSKSAVTKLDDADQVMLQATSIILDNLAQVAMGAGKMDDAIAYSKQDLENLNLAYPVHDPRLLAGQSQYLKVLLETQRMDDAEVQCEEMLKSFPHPSPQLDTSSATPVIPKEVTLESSRIYDELSNVMYQYQNLDYAEKFLQISLIILRARLIDESTGKTLAAHPALSRAYNGLGLLQLQMSDYTNAEAHLKAALDMKQRMVKDGLDRHSAAMSGPDAGPTSDNGMAEYYHNFGLAQMGNKKFDEAEKSLLTARSLYHLRYAEPDGTVNLVHATYAGLCTQLTQLYKLLDRSPEALKMSLEAVSVKSQLFTPTSTQLSNDLYTTAMLHAKVGEHDKAIPLYQQLLSILEKPQGGQPPNPAALGAVYTWLARTYEAMQENAQAAGAMRKAVDCCEKAKMGATEIQALLAAWFKMAETAGLDTKEIKEKITATHEKEKQRAAAATATTSEKEGAQFST